MCQLLNASQWYKDYSTRVVTDMTDTSMWLPSCIPLTGAFTLKEHAYGAFTSGCL
jgi:hypothetical protein